MLRARTSACLVAVLGIILVPFAGAAVSAPDWLHQLAAQPSGSYPAETNAVILLDQTDYTVTAPGDYTEHSRWVVRILRPEGRKRGDLLLDLGQNEKLNWIHAWTIDNSGHEYELKQKDFTQKSFPSYALYDDIRFLNAKAPASDPGSVIAFEFEVKRRSFVNQINQFFQEPDPVRELQISLTLPAGWEFKDSWPAATPVKPSQTSPGHWEWTAHDLAGIQREPMMPHESAMLGRLSIAYFPPGESGNTASWNALGHWYSTLSAGRRDPGPEIVDEVSKLTAGKTDFDAKLKAITAFLQTQIRYVAIEIGIGGYQPHPAREVFRSRYGDCKDKATLLSSMLHVAGINSDYVLIDTDRGFVNPDVPSVWFDHAILAIELPPSIDSKAYHSLVTSKTGEKYLIFDPTDEYTPVGTLRADLQGSYALLVTEGGGELIHTPLLDPGWNQITRSGKFVLSSDGTLSGDVNEDRSGDSATHERERLHYSDQRESTNAFQEWLGRSLQGFTLDDMKIQQADEITKDLIMNYRFTTPQYAQSRGALMLLRPRVVGTKARSVEHKPRLYPLELGSTVHETDIYEIELPKEYKVDDVPDPVNIDVGFASYRSNIKVEGSKLVYSREYVVRDVSVPPEKFNDWTKLQGLIGADENAAVVLKRAE